MKNAFVRSKQTAEATQDPQHHSANEYATNHMTGGARDVTQSAVHRLKNPRKKATQNVNKAKEQFRRARQQFPKARKEAAEQAKKAAETAKSNADKLGKAADQAKKAAQGAQKSVFDAKRTLQQTRQAGRQTVQTAKQAGRGAKSTGKGTVKTVKKSVKTAERSAKATVKTAQKTAKAAQQSAKAAAKTAKIAAQASRAAAKASVQATKLTVKAVVAMVKAAIAAIKGLVSAIAAGGWVAVVIIIVICLIGLLVGSIFGIFFSGEDSGNGYTMPMAIQEINQEYVDKLAEIRNNNAHDEVHMSGSRANWKEMLAVYAVKINTGPENAQDVASMDEGKKELLRAVFWDMNTLDYYTKIKEVTETLVDSDGVDYSIAEQTVTKTFLYITVSHKTAAEMAEQYGFSEQQKAQLNELLSDQYAELWSSVLYGIHNGSSDIVAVAISQIGNVGGDPYWSWYGFPNHVAWCACFVSWCANECGYIDAGVFPRFSYCPTGIALFKERGQWQDGGYVPTLGDIIFFDWEQDGISDHVGIVEYVEGDVVHTVEGNRGNSVRRCSYRLDSVQIYGYGTPIY